MAEKKRTKNFSREKRPGVGNSEGTGKNSPLTGEINPSTQAMRFGIQGKRRHKAVSFNERATWRTGGILLLQLEKYTDRKAAKG